VTALAFALAVTVAAALACIVWAVRRGDQAGDRATRATVGLAHTEAEGERTAYELEVTRAALSAAQTRIKTLEGALDDAIRSTPLGTGLDARDAAGRVRRVLSAWGQAADARDPLSADPRDGLLDPRATDAPDVAGG
jgi:hypothetical protein